MHDENEKWENGAALAGEEGAVSFNGESMDSAEKWHRILHQLEHELNVCEDPARRARFNYALGEINEVRFGLKDAAMRYYQLSHESDPGYKPTIKAALRLFIEAGAWEMASDLASKLENLSLSESERAALYVSMASLFADRLGRREKAVEYLNKALTIEPDNIAAFRKLESLHIEAQDRHALINFYRRFIEDVNFSDYRGELYLSLADELAVDPEKDVEAIEAYRRAVEFDPHNLLAFNSLKKLLFASRRWLELLDIYGEEESVTEDAARLAVLKYQRARILSGELDDVRSALALLREGLELDAGNSLLLDELESLYEASGQWDRQAEVRRLLFDLAATPEERVEIAYRLGELYEEKLDNLDAAAEWFEKTLEMRGDYLPALQALERIYDRAGKNHKLFEIIIRQAQATSDKKLKASRYFNAAEVAQARLNDPELVVEQYRKVLDLLPGYLPAVKALSELYTFMGRPRDLIDMNEMLASNIPNINPEQYLYLMEKNGSLWEQLGDLNNAINCYERILSRLGEHLDTIKNLGRLYARAGRWESLITINEQESALINDQHRIVSLLCKCGEVAETKMHDEGRAIEYYRKVLVLSPAYHPAVKALGAIYARLKRWEELIRMYHRELDTTDEVELKTGIRFRIGQIYEEDLKNPRKAEVNYRQILEEDPSFMPALHALVRLHSHNGNAEALLEIHHSQLERCTDEPQKVFHLFKIAELQAGELNNPQGAVEAYRQLLEIDPPNRLARAALERLYAASGDRENLLTLLRRELVEEEGLMRRLNLLAQVADIFEELGRIEEAAATCREILVLSPTEKSAFQKLETLLKKLEQYKELPALYEQRARGLKGRARLDLLSSQADILENHVEDPEALAVVYGEMLRIDPVCLKALEFFEKAYAEAGEWDQLVEIYERRRALESDEEEKLRLTAAAAGLLEVELGRQAEALELYEAALAIRPDHFPSIQGARRLYFKLEQWGKLAELLESELKSKRSSSYCVAAAYQLGHLLETRFENNAAASELYRRVLELRPKHREAFIRLRRILEMERNHIQLMELLERRLSVLETMADQVEMHRTIADLAENELSDLEKAVNHRRLLLELQPGDTEEMLKLAELHRKASQHMDAVTCFKKAAERIDDAVRLRNIYYAIGEIYSHGLSDSHQAMAAFEKVLEYRPDDLQATEQLAEIYMKSKMWDQAAETLTMLLVNALPRERAVRYHLNLGEIYLEHLEQEEKAISNFEKALALNPSGQTSLETLTRIFSRKERWGHLIRIYEHTLEGLGEGEREKEIPLLLGLGAIHRDQLNDVEKSLEVFARAAKQDPDDLRVTEAQAVAMGRSPIYYLDAIDKHRRLLEQDPYRIESYSELYRIFHERQERDKAFCAAMALEFLRAENQQQTEFLAQCRQFTSGEAMGVIIPEAEREVLLIHPAEKGLVRDILMQLEPCMYHMEEANLDDYDLPGCRVAGVASSIYHLMESTAYYLGVELFKLYISQKQPDQLAVENTRPPTIIIGGSLAYASEGIKRFIAGCVVGRIGNGHVVYSQKHYAWLQTMAEAACYMFNPEISVYNASASQVEAIGLQLNRHLSPTARHELEAKAAEYARLETKPDYQNFQLAMQYSDDRMGLVMAGELRSAVESVLHLDYGKPFRPAMRSDEIIRQLVDERRAAELFRFSVSEDFFKLRQVVRQNLE